MWYLGHAMATQPIPIPRAATYEDLLRVPDHKVAEILDGELIVSPRPAPRHANASSALGGDLFGPFQRGRGGPGGWWILDEPEVHLGRDVIVPDLAAWRLGRLPRLPETPYFALAPDWACEIVSPSTERHDRMRKMAIYAREQVQRVWLINPLLRTLEVYALEPGPRWALVAVHGGDEVARIEPFDAVELELASLWADIAPAEASAAEPAEAPEPEIVG
jgi:Uma2 family endonuclease